MPKLIIMLSVTDEPTKSNYRKALALKFTTLKELIGSFYILVFQKKGKEKKRKLD